MNISQFRQLIDHIITTHPAYSELQSIAKDKGSSIHVVLADILEDLRKKASRPDFEETLTGLTKDIHLYPDFHGLWHFLILSLLDFD